MMAFSLEENSLIQRNDYLIVEPWICISGGRQVPEDIWRPLA